MVEDDDDSDYGHSKKRGKKVIRRGRTDKKEKKSPKPRLKATGEMQLQVEVGDPAAASYFNTLSESALWLCISLPQLIK